MNWKLVVVETVSNTELKPVMRDVLNLTKKNALLNKFSTRNRFESSPLPPTPPPSPVPSPQFANFGVRTIFEEMRKMLLTCYPVRPFYLKVGSLFLPCFLYLLFLGLLIYPHSRWSSFLIYFPQPSCHSNQQN